MLLKLNPILISMIHLRIGWSSEYCCISWTVLWHCARS